MVYHKSASGNNLIDAVDISDDEKLLNNSFEILEKFRAFLRSLMMHAGVGTALGGVMTVGEPQNCIWEQAKMELCRFSPYGTRDYSCVYLRITHLFLGRKIRYLDTGEKLPDEVWKVLSDLDRT